MSFPPFPQAHRSAANFVSRRSGRRANRVERARDGATVTSRAIAASRGSATLCRACHTSNPTASSSAGVDPVRRIQAWSWRSCGWPRSYAPTTGTASHEDQRRATKPLPLPRQPKSAGCIRQRKRQKREALLALRSALEMPMCLRYSLAQQTVRWSFLIRCMYSRLPHRPPCLFELFRHQLQHHRSNHRQGCRTSRILAISGCPRIRRLRTTMWLPIPSISVCTRPILASTSLRHGKQAECPLPTPS